MTSYTTSDTRRRTALSAILNLSNPMIDAVRFYSSPEKGVCMFIAPSAPRQQTITALVKRGLLGSDDQLTTAGYDVAHELGDLGAYATWADELAALAAAEAALSFPLYQPAPVEPVIFIDDPYDRLVEINNRAETAYRATHDPDALTTLLLLLGSSDFLVRFDAAEALFLLRNDAQQHADVIHSELAYAARQDGHPNSQSHMVCAAAFYADEAQ